MSDVPENKPMIPCFLCRVPVAVNTSRREKPYYICNNCGCQFFTRGKKAVSLLNDIVLNQGVVVVYSEPLSIVELLDSLKARISEFSLFDNSDEKKLLKKELDRVERLLKERLSNEGGR